MEVIVGIIVIGVIMKIANDWSISYQNEKRGHEAFRRGMEGMKENNKRMAKEGDYYYNSATGFMDMNKYGDGSRRYDDRGERVEKGK